MPGATAEQYEAMLDGAAAGGYALGRYLLAATFGNVHGTYAPGNVKLRPRVLADGQKALAQAHRRSVPVRVPRRVGLDARGDP